MIKSLEARITKFAAWTGRCKQGCGRFVKRDRMFCSGECLNLYTPHTWGEGRKSSLAPILKNSLQAVQNGAD